ncbi:McrB family protein [Flavobacterium terrae]|uniref:AAA domain (Dynein-related subfamily) n=1 Tax=Flavobacterium terrae TaxID=415425 RepID=A0A1M6F269_9FLAO|nr:AAA family ATPase [Flavobacterium terrae]SHI91782.1 AAA domain (dynein-related subfamily) [Flavobacterium terrae]
MSELQNKILKLSNEILDYLLEFKKNNPDFTFSLRKRDSAQSKGVKRLATGQWFQGSHYIYVPLFYRGDNARKIKTIGFVISFKKDGSLNNYIEISFKDGITTFEEKEFHRMLAKFLNLKLNSKNNGQKVFDNQNDIWNNLNYYITDFRNYALKLIEDFDIKDKYLISENEFQKDLKRILAIKKTLLPISIDSSQNIIPKTLNKMLNQILYGPPGTGKTYHTINKAIEICNPSFNLEHDRKVLKDEFDRLVKEEQIVFTTFHQSMSYEDFIEGIKPKTVNNTVHYEIEDGLFKQICHKARTKNGNFDAVIETFKKDISEIDGKQALTINAPNSSFDVIYRGTNVFYVQPHNSSKDNPWYPVNISNMQIAFETNNYDKLYNPTYIRGILHYLTSNYKLVKGESENNKNYVLIIDEINRGNVSQIFGELITLIEESKRLGNDEALEVTLPYSKDLFGVPPNLYIIGTMNTADRSVEALDTALRRRFSFEEMMPQTELLTPSALYCKLLWEYKDVRWENKEFMEKEKSFFEVFGCPDDFNIKKNDIWETMKESDDKTKLDYFKDFSFSLDLSKILKTINKRIELLLDRDHTIGHSYFINVNSLEDLENTFKNNIIPLLQEYFYNDYEKIALVLGEGFVEIKRPQDNQVKFAKLSVGLEQPELQTEFAVKKGFDIQKAINLLGSNE